MLLWDHWDGRIIYGYASTYAIKRGRMGTAAWVSRGSGCGRLYQTALVGLVVVSMFVIGACSQGPGSATPDEEITRDCNGVDRAIVFAGFDWGSAQISNHIAGRILQDGFGCKVRRYAGTDGRVPGLVRGEIDIVMEVWDNTASDTYREAVSTGDVVDLGLNMIAREYSFLVPRHVIEGDAERDIHPMAPDLRTVADLPKYSSIFQDPEQPGQGVYRNCVVDWQCAQINTDKLATYGLDPYFTNFRPETESELDAALATAYESGEPWLGYYWGPTSVLGRFDMVVIAEPEYSEDCWVDGNRGCAYPANPVNVAISKGFSELAAESMLDFLTAYEMDQFLMSELLAYMTDENTDAASAAVHFLVNKSDVWTEWVTTEVADRIKASLN